MWTIGRVGFAAVLLGATVSGQSPAPPARAGSRVAAPQAVATTGGNVTAGSCDALASLALPNVRVTSAKIVAAGGFSPGGDTARGVRAASFNTVRSFCRVTATLTPSTDS